MTRTVLIFISLLFVTCVAYGADIPDSMLNNNVFVKSGGEIRYTSMYKLGQFVSILKSEAIKSNKAFKVTKSGSLYLLDLTGKNNTKFKFYIDSKNFLKKYEVNNKGGAYSFDDSKPLDLVRASTVILPFVDVMEEQINSQKKVSEKNKAKYIKDNMLNFDVHMPLFAGLQWGDKFASVLSKLRKVNGIYEMDAKCEYSNKLESTLDGDKLHSLNYGDLGLITEEDAKNISNEIIGCTIRGTVVLFDTKARIETSIGRTSYGGIDTYLNNINICGVFGANRDKLIEAYKVKYKDYNEKVAGASDTKKYDMFGSSVDFEAACWGGNAVSYNKPLDISDLQNQIIADENNKKISDGLKSQKQADGAI